MSTAMVCDGRTHDVVNDRWSVLICDVINDRDGLVIDVVIDVVRAELVRGEGRPS